MLTVFISRTWNYEWFWLFKKLSYILKTVMITYCYYKYISFNIKGNKDRNMRPTLLVTECPPTISGNDAAELPKSFLPTFDWETHLNPKIVQGKKMEREEDIKFLLALIFMFHVTLFSLLVCSSFQTETIPSLLVSCRSNRGMAPWMRNKENTRGLKCMWGTSNRRKGMCWGSVEWKHRTYEKMGD